MAECDVYKLTKKQDEMLVYDLYKREEVAEKGDYSSWNSFMYFDSCEGKYYVLSILDCEVNLLFYIADKTQTFESKKIHIPYDTLKQYFDVQSDEPLELTIVRARKVNNSIEFYIVASNGKDVYLIKVIYDIDNGNISVMYCKGLKTDKKNYLKNVFITYGVKTSSKEEDYEFWYPEENKIILLVLGGMI